MKKIAYIAAALIAVVGCSKKEIVSEPAGTHDIFVSVALTDGTTSSVAPAMANATKATFDGDSHIKFNGKNDSFLAAIAKTDAPNTAIKVLAPNARLGYCSSFSIVDDGNGFVDPVFSGKISKIADEDFADEYIMYGIYPSAASDTYSFKADLTNFTVKLIPDQGAARGNDSEKDIATQTSWSSKADVMVLQPAKISTTGAGKDEDGNNEFTSGSNKIKLAHLFGFGKMTFAGIPEKYKDLVVESVKIESTEEGKYLAGEFTLDLTKDIEDMTLTEGRYYNMKDYISLTGDGTTTISNYVAWFVANPGVYNVRVTVSAGSADFVFEREGLTVSRGKLTEPVVNYKEKTDACKDYDVVLRDNAMWNVTFTSDNVMNSYNSTRVWGDNGVTMPFVLSYPGSTNNNYGGSPWSGKCVQQLANMPINGGKVVLSSKAAFDGVKQVKINVGLQADKEDVDKTADFTVTLVNGTETYGVGKATVKATERDKADGETYFYNVPDGKTKGKLVITVDNITIEDKDCIPYIGALTINPAPEISLSADKLNLPKEETSGDIDCTISAAEGTPVVTVSDDAKDWLTASYAEGKVSYTAKANAGTKRVGSISVSATGLSTTVAVIEVKQKGEIEVEYKLTVTAKNVYDVIQANIAAGTVYENYSKYPLTFSVDAVSTKDASKTTKVEINCEKINCLGATEESFSSNGYIIGNVGAISKLVFTCDQKIGYTSYSDVILKFSDDGENWGYADSGKVTTEGKYTYTFVDETAAYSWFNILGTSYPAVKITGFEVTFTE